MSAGKFFTFIFAVLLHHGNQDRSSKNLTDIIGLNVPENHLLDTSISVISLIQDEL